MHRGWFIENRGRNVVEREWHHPFGGEHAPILYIERLRENRAQAEQQ